MVDSEVTVFCPYMLCCLQFNQLVFNLMSIIYLPERENRFVNSIREFEIQNGDDSENVT